MKTFVSETDPSVEVRRVSLGVESAAMCAYVALPRESSPRTPSIVLAMHLTGIDAGLRDTARRFAKDGFATIVPDLYHRFQGVPDGDAEPDVRAFIPFAKQLVRENVDRDILAAARWLQEAFPQGKTAIAGFCMGGVIALVRCAGYAPTFAAAAVWYGSVQIAAIDPKRIDIPVVASYGEEDSGIPPEGVRAFFGSVPAPHDLAIYAGAGHAFFDQTRATYRAEAAEDSWRRSIAFLSAHAR